MVDVVTKGRRRHRVREDKVDDKTGEIYNPTAMPVRRKRPDADDPFVVAARLERQERLSVPLRARIEAEGVYDDHGPTKADIRDDQEDSTREKNANLRDRENEKYEDRRERVMERWGDKIERKEKRDAIIGQRKEREARREAALSGESVPREMLSLPVANNGLISQVAKVENRRGSKKPAPSLFQQIEEAEHLDTVLPRRVVEWMDNPRKSNGRG